MYVDRSGQAKKRGEDLHKSQVAGAAEEAPASGPAGFPLAGHYMALRVGFAFPMEEVNELPRPWVEAYTRSGYMMHDPVIRWAYESEGACRWSEIDLPDRRGVLAAARDHGLRFGVAVSFVDRVPGGMRSWGSFARADREFSDAEMATLLAHLRGRHEALAPPRNITPAELEALRLIKDGQRLKQIAWQLGVTEGAVKQRLKNARIKLEAKTGAEAISRASALRLI